MTLPLPPGAADCHMHVIGPFDRYPLAAERAYTVPEALLESHERMKRRAGLERTVLVQLSGHGEDNRALLAALEALGPRGRGIAVLPWTVSMEELKTLDAQGIRGLRLNLATLKSRYGSDYGALVAEYGRLLAPLGWHLQVFADGPTLLFLNRFLLKAEIPVVIDHMGLPDAARGISQPEFQNVLELAAAKHIWVKLAGADRITRSTGRLRDAIPFMQALARVAPQRLVWGSDWPHLGFHANRQVTGTEEITPHRDLDVKDLLAVLFEAVPDAAGQRAILVDNPARLYGFAAA